MLLALVVLLLGAPAAGATPAAPPGSAALASPVAGPGIVARARAVAHVVAAVVAQVGPGAVRVVYEPPVDAPVVDPFRPPTTPYGPGNRGWEYAPGRGTVVRAAADGVVTFAGPVGGTVAVTVLHADGLRTSYSLLESAAVTEGDRVRRGEPVGRSGERFHFGVRRGDTYLDPAGLFTTDDPGPPPRPRPRLVPLDR